MLHLDFIHQSRSLKFEKRDTTGYIFGREIPAWIIFHSMLGYVLLVVGVVAFVLRLPIFKSRKLHPYFGYAYLWGIVWMPITAIWCVRDSFEWSVVAFFIFSMYAAAETGWLSIRVLLQKQPDLQTGRKQRIGLKIVHGILMTYSIVMLLGAAITFPFRVVAGDM